MTNTATTTTPAASVPPNPTGAIAAGTWFNPMHAERLLTPEVLGWLDEAEAAQLHPAVVADRLRRQQGWVPEAAAAVAERYRLRFDEHGLGYFALLCSTGLTALGAATSAHIALNGMTGTIDRPALAFWLTVGFCAAPFAAWSHWWAKGVDADDPAAVWSRQRRSYATLLQWTAVVVGIARFFEFVGRLMFSLTGATPLTSTAITKGALNVAVTCAIALPIGVWAYWFGHRFADEDPPAKRRPSRRAVAAGASR